MSKIYSKQIVGQRESVSSELLLLNPHQTPLINLLGYSEPVASVEYTWFEDGMAADKSALTAAAAVDATALTVADPGIFRVHDVLKVGDELVKVTAINGSALTVTRAYAGTVAAAATSGAMVEFQFVEGVEGADARAARYKPRARKSNFTQIFDETVSITGTAAEIAQYGFDDMYEYEKQKKQTELALQLEKALINGIKYEGPDNLVRQMGGLRYFTKSNVIDAAKADLADAQINDAMQKIYEKGGFSTGGNYYILTGAKQKRAISNFDKSQIRLDRRDNGRGQVADYFVSDFGQAEIVLNNNLSPDELFIVDVNRLAIRPLGERDFFHEYLGRKGDYYQGQIIGEYTFEVKQEAAHARIKNLK